ncbi:response regulator receiver domain protein [bacterium BMS3Bbin14]|nr:response regulator receiver domain protein [bacterium BMS3Abin13]GBE51966.1 response regulator receiver domain protein [bacterium BMS3Bbin14]HDK43485.1 response regulator [Desulfobacteraceae bacterium]HDO29550.1 response regulator [Desulfobacteraceae bacterium]
MAKIFVADGDGATAGQIGVMLQEAGHVVRFCREVEEVASLVRADMPDLVILEMRFPGKGLAGIALARALTADPHLCRVPLLMLSDFNRESGLPFVLGENDISEDFLPVDAFLDKPVPADRLLATINSLLAPGGSHPCRHCPRSGP